MKVKIVGNILLNFVFWGVTLCGPVDLRITTMSGAHLSRAGAGEPFLVEVVASGTDSTQTPKVEGLNSFNVHTAGLYIRSINGRSSVTHRYKVRIDKIGEYKIGPATVLIDGKPKRSNIIELTVGDQQVAQTVRTKKTATGITNIYRVIA